MPVERYPLTPGLNISRVLTGLWQVADMERDGKQIDIEAAARDLTSYVDAGMTTFDMADHYGSAELIAGACRKKASDSIQCLTKWVPSPGPLTKDETRQAVTRAMKRLQCDKIDLMQFHAWSYADPRWLDALFWLDELRAEGLIAHLGLTNFDTNHLAMVIHSGIPVVSNQVSFSLLDQRASGRMQKFCMDHGVRLLAFGTLAGGFLSERWLHAAEPSPTALQTWSQMKYKRFIDTAGGWQLFQNLLKTLENVAHEQKASISNIATRFILDQPAVAGVIIGARPGTSSHLNDNLKLFDVQLTDRQRQSIVDALKKMKAIPGDCGDEYRKPPFLTASGDLSHHLENFPAPYPTRPSADGASIALSGTIWEDLAGFSRGIRKGNRIMISGTTATHGDRVIGGKDPASQLHFIMDKIEGALQSLGGRLEHIVRTRIYIRDFKDWEVLARAHGDRFRHIQPANTMIKADIIGDAYIVEMEAEALLTLGGIAGNT